MSTAQELLSSVLQQSAWDLNARPEDFTRSENIVVSMEHLGNHAKKYYQEPISCNFVSFGSNVVACSREIYRPIAEEYLRKFTYYHCFETPSLYWLNEQLEPYGQKVCFMAEYWLPDPERIRRLPCPYELKILTQKDFAALYRPEWSNALCESRKELDVLGVGAYDNGKLIGLAACSADAEQMRQIGIDVLPEYRRQGVASALTSHLAMEILERDLIPFYCCAWSNMASARNAIRSGFRPAWAEMTVKPAETVDSMNQSPSEPAVL